MRIKQNNNSIKTFIKIPRINIDHIAELTHSLNRMFNSLNENSYINPFIQVSIMLFFDNPPFNA